MRLTLLLLQEVLRVPVLSTLALVELRAVPMPIALRTLFASQAAAAPAALLSPPVSRLSLACRDSRCRIAPRHYTTGPHGKRLPKFPVLPGREVNDRDQNHCRERHERMKELEAARRFG